MSRELPPVGPSGAIARVFQNNHLTPLLAILAIILGVLAVVVTPKEEEPQIDVTMADIMVAELGYAQNLAITNDSRYLVTFDTTSPHISSALLRGPD